jgi:hypothetical protein
MAVLHVDCANTRQQSHTPLPKSTTLPQIGKFLIGFIAIFHLPFAVDDLLLSTI